MNTVAQELLTILKADLKEIFHSTESLPAKFKAAYKRSRDCSTALVKDLHSFHFKEKQEEIEFFKRLKPEIFSRLFFFKRMEGIISDCEGKKKGEQKKILILNLYRIEDFIDHNEEAYNYYKEKRTDFDDKFFTRCTYLDIKHFSSIKCHEVLFSVHDITYAKFMAYEEVRLFIIDKLYEIVESNLPLLEDRIWVSEDSGDHWTGTFRDFTQLVRGLYFTKSINDGKISQRKIFEGTKKLLSIKQSLEEFYKVSNQLKSRKKEEGCFFDKLKNAYYDNIDK